MATTMTVQCPSCDTDFPVDPSKVPEGGVRTQCTVCETQFRVDPPVSEAWAEAADEPWQGGEPEEETADIGMEAATAVGAPDADDVEVEEAAEEDTPSYEAAEPEDASGEPAEAAVDEAPSDWVMETEDSGMFGVSGESEVELDDLGMDEQTAAADLDLELTPDTESSADDVEGDEDQSDEGDDAYTAFMADEVMLSADDLDMMVGEVDVDPVPVAGEETPELPPLEPAMDEPEAEFGAETVLEDLSEVETVFEPEEAETVSADEPMGEPYVDPSAEAESVTGDVDLSSLEAGFGLAEEAEADGTDGHPGPEEHDGSAGDVAEAHAEPVAHEADIPAAAPMEVDAGVVEETVVEADVVEVEETVAEADVAEVEEEESAAPAGFQFGKRDPHEKARRLARVLVSDMITYNPERHARALENDSIEEDFEEEIEKSWAEYVEQVGGELARSTSYWTDALNEILARGKPLF